MSVCKIVDIHTRPLKLGEIGLINTVRNLCFRDFSYPIHALGNCDCQTTFIISSGIQTQGLQSLMIFFFFWLPFKNKAIKIGSEI